MSVIRVATLDYLEKIKKIIEIPEFVKLEKIHETMKYAETDPLTGVFTRKTFMDRLNQEVSSANQKKNPFCLVMLDLDGFKNLNDTLGHQAGDTVLQKVAELLKNSIRKDDITARYGGDEFIILLLDINKFNARKVCEKLRQQIENEFKSYGITVSIGIAEFPVDAAVVDDLIKQADELLYCAKALGGNKVTYSEFVEIKYKDTDGKAKEVCCIGDFNRWDKKQGIMQFSPQTNEWVIKLNLKPGKYRYAILVDDIKWARDPQAEIADEGFGGECSVLKIQMD